MRKSRSKLRSPDTNGDVAGLKPRALLKRRPGLEAPKPGRPPLPLLKSPHRFEVVLYLFFTDYFGLQRSHAARWVLLLLSKHPIAVNSIEDILFRLSVEPEQEARGKERTIMRRCGCFLDSPPPVACDWLGKSYAALGLAFFIKDPTAQGFNDLRAFGWEDALLLRLARRVNDAIDASNRPPVEEKLSLGVKRILADLRKRAEKKR